MNIKTLLGLTVFLVSFCGLSAPSFGRTVIGIPMSGGPSAPYSVGDECVCPGTCSGINLSTGQFGVFQCVSGEESGELFSFALP